MRYEGEACDMYMKHDGITGEATISKAKDQSD